MFNLVAPVTNAAWLSGAIILAVSLKRGGTVSTAVAAGLPITWVAVIPLATIGDGVIAGAYYLIIGYLLINNMIEPGAARPVGEGCGAEYPGSDVRRQKVDDGRPAGSGGAPSGAAV